MNIPIPIVAAFGAVILSALISGYVSLASRMRRVERYVLIIVTMLAERGMPIPETSDTDRLLRDR